jgi:hypothetical protein
MILKSLVSILELFKGIFLYNYLMYVKQVTIYIGTQKNSELSQKREKEKKILGA